MGLWQKFFFISFFFFLSVTSHENTAEQKNIPRLSFLPVIECWRRYYLKASRPRSEKIKFEFTGEREVEIGIVLFGGSFSFRHQRVQSKFASWQSRGGFLSFARKISRSFSRDIFHEKVDFDDFREWKACLLISVCSEVFFNFSTTRTAGPWCIDEKREKAKKKHKNKRQLQLAVRRRQSQVISFEFGFVLLLFRARGGKKKENSLIN